MLIYVDDCLLLGEPEAIQRVLDLMKMHFNITHTAINEDVDFIGCDLSWKDGSICLSQQKYIERLQVKPIKRRAAEIASSPTACSTRES